ncbi:hypothetical protein GGQ64_000829 [Rhizobium azooxidifex]|uniref:Uncharacterized protein n=1 Tax=Mycoplana azooxidifex TaxID=1636188 RepID=A0A7W6D7P8_9HYPH|nr:hypothetical protein [Mycoplana azooxidifex]MBB3975642.1 hypothetical protein [Mycoplana azooxidifex]
MKPVPRCTDRDGLLDILMSGAITPGDTTLFLDMLDREISKRPRNVDIVKRPSLTAREPRR